ncbi:MAG: hypothetical protein JG718_17730 [Candidatus Thiothrix moscowensis]|nr:hypothetical protein [Candidatus Thiothrix moscowensis]
MSRLKILQEQSKALKEIYKDMTSMPAFSDLIKEYELDEENGRLADMLKNIIHHSTLDRFKAKDLSEKIDRIRRPTNRAKW